VLQSVAVCCSVYVGGSYVNACQTRQRVAPSNYTVQFRHFNVVACCRVLQSVAECCGVYVGGSYGNTCQTRQRGSVTHPEEGCVTLHAPQLPRLKLNDRKKTPSRGCFLFQLFRGPP